MKLSIIPKKFSFPSNCPYCKEHITISISKHTLNKLRRQAQQTPKTITLVSNCHYCKNKIAIDITTETLAHLQLLFKTTNP